MSIPYETYPKNIKALYHIWRKAGIWRKHNWYDFLETLLKIHNETNTTKKKK